MVTLEGWSGILYLLADSAQSWLAIVFCILIVIIGSFFLLNVVLAVLSDKPPKHVVERKKMEEAKRKRDDFVDACKFYKIDDPEIQEEDEKFMN
jgi:hypothetical protein